MSTPKTANSNAVAFRAPDELLHKLDAQCRQLKLSRGELVRAIVTLHFETPTAALVTDVQQLVSKVGVVHRNQARSLVALLTTVGNISHEDAKKIACETLLS